MAMLHAHMLLLGGAPHSVGVPSPAISICNPFRSGNLEGKGSGGRGVESGQPSPNVSCREGSFFSELKFHN